MNFDLIINDPLIVDKINPSLNYPVTFDSFGDTVIGVLLKAQGRGPHPTILLLHGFPGYEMNFDLAHIFRRAGYNVMIFHYRGSWGSKGIYSFTHALEDVTSALKYLKKKDSIETYGIDPEKIILIGHSFGGFAALMSAASNDELKYVVSIAGYNLGQVAEDINGDEEAIKVTINNWQDCIPPLNGTSVEMLIAETINNKDRWQLLRYAGELSKRSVLLIAGSRDEISKINVHHFPLVKEIQNNSPDQFMNVVLDGDHDFCDKRTAVAKDILMWFENEGIK